MLEDKEPQDHSPITEGRVGKFILPDHVMVTTPYEVLLRVMSNFLVVRAEMLYAQRGIEYTAYSSLFELVDRGERIPEYLMFIDTDSDDLLQVRVKRC